MHAVGAGTGGPACATCAAATTKPTRKNRCIIYFRCAVYRRSTSVTVRMRNHRKLGAPVPIALPGHRERDRCQAASRCDLKTDVIVHVAPRSKRGLFTAAVHLQQQCSSVYRVWFFLAAPWSDHEVSSRAPLFRQP